jgi:hypothetical protein
MRFAVPASAESQAPYARPTSLFSSQSRGNGKLNFFANAALSETLSKETPSTSALFFWNSP